MWIPMGRLSLMLLALSSINAQDACKTPRDKPGSCIVINQCKELNDLLLNSYRTPEETRYLNASQCGQEGLTLKVCCSDGATQPLVDFQSLLYPECGLESDEDWIIGGEEAGIRQYPWMGIIEYQNKAGRIRRPCAGSLIAKKYVVTAAHCVAGRVLDVIGTPVNVRFGVFNKTNTGQECVNGGGQNCTDEPVVIPIEQYIPHPEFEKGASPKNDIAVIRLSREAPYTDFIRPICLPDSDRTVDLGTNQLQLVAAGWRLTETNSTSPRKLHLKMPFYHQDACQNAFEQSGLTVTLWNKQLCAGGLASKDLCHVDSGGPLMHFVSIKYNLIGVFSYGPRPCGKNGVPDVYTKVFAYLDWIKAQMRP